MDGTITISLKDYDEMQAELEMLRNKLNEHDNKRKNMIKKEFFRDFKASPYNNLKACINVDADLIYWLAGASNNNEVKKRTTIKIYNNEGSE